MSAKVLTSDELRELLREFKQTYGEQYNLRALGYFGSYARDEAGSESDVDIVFESGRPNLYDTVMLKQDLEAFIGRRVDVLQLRGLGNSRLRARIEEEAVYV